MAFSPFARWRNFTVDNFKALLEVYPDLAKQFSWSEVGELIEKEINGYKKTAYQQACQFGIENRGIDQYKIHNYLFTFEDKNIEKYLQFWMKTYYAPNPYVQSDDEPIIIYCELLKEILSSESLTIDFHDFFVRRIGGKSEDILLNAIKYYCFPIEHRSIGNNNSLFISRENIGKAKDELSFIENEFPIYNPTDRETFYNRYSYSNYCKFFGLSDDGIINDKYVSSSSVGTGIRGFNKVYYGTPGCGKSYKVMKEWENNPVKPQRTTFYPDYTNSDFVGQVLPGLDENGQPTYEFIEGPFTKALIDAFNNPNDNVALIIEDLNRGNAAAIFGEIFQLLDRDNTGKSQYSIYNPNIIKELNKQVINKPDGQDFDSVYIPGNMSIIATMNTSDQNVYPLDTAFQRRWKFEKIKNSFLKDGIKDEPEYYDDPDNYVSRQAYELSKMFIPGTATTWKDFVDALNKRIVEDHDATFSSEDKQIGVYFLSKDELTEERYANSREAAKMFSEKMLKYIWEDIAKLNPEDWFDECKCLDDVFDGFNENQLRIFKNIDFSKEQ